MPTILYADRIRNNQFSTIYKNANNSLDFTSFYEDMDNVPDDYFMYIKYQQNNSPASASSLMKFGPGIGAILNTDDDIQFVFYWQGLYTNLEAQFSPFNYTNAASAGWVPMGIKRNSYNRFEERWNYYINIMNDLAN
jgi:hypothetical protein